MNALIDMLLALALLLALLRSKVRIGRAMIISAFALALLLAVTPAQMARHFIFEWQNKPFTQTTGFLFVSLTALLLFVNVLAAAMRQTGVSERLVPAMQALFRSRRVALAIIPFIMGMLPTPGGIMLSAPMVRQLGDHIGVSRSRQGAINFYFRHIWEPIWPLFPAIPIIQGLFGISAFTIISYNCIIFFFGLATAIVVLLLTGIPPRQGRITPTAPMHHNLRDFLHVFWPIALAAILYVGFGLHPAGGILIAIFAFLAFHKIPFKRWPPIFKAAREPDLALLILGALFFKFNLEAAGAIGQVMDFLTAADIPQYLIVFFLPFLVAILTGITSVTVLITFPFLAPLIVTPNGVRMGWEVLAFSGILAGLYLTPVHLCLPLSAGYFQTSFAKIIKKLLIPIAAIIAAGITMAVICN